MNWRQDKRTLTLQVGAIRDKVTSEIARSGPPLYTLPSFVSPRSVSEVTRKSRISPTIYTIQVVVSTGRPSQGRAALGYETGIIVTPRYWDKGAVRCADGVSRMRYCIRVSANKPRPSRGGWLDPTSLSLALTNPSYALPRSVRTDRVAIRSAVVASRLIKRRADASHCQIPRSS